MEIRRSSNQESRQCHQVGFICASALTLMEMFPDVRPDYGTNQERAVMSRP